VAPRFLENLCTRGLTVESSSKNEAGYKVLKTAVQQIQIFRDVTLSCRVK